MVQVDAVAPEQSPHLLEGGLLPVDVVGGAVVLVGRSGDGELAVGDDVIIISFLARGEKIRIRIFHHTC